MLQCKGKTAHESVKTSNINIKVTEEYNKLNIIQRIKSYLRHFTTSKIKSLELIELNKRARNRNTALFKSHNHKNQHKTDVAKRM